MHKERGRNMSVICNEKQGGEEGGEGVEKNDNSEENNEPPPGCLAGKEDEAEEKLDDKKDCEDDGNTMEEIEQDEDKTDYTAVEHCIVKIEEETEKEVLLNDDENIELTNENAYSGGVSADEKLLLGCQKKGIFPDAKPRKCKLSEVPNLKRCLIEHSYFQIAKPGFIPLTDQGNIRVNTCPTTKITVPFENRIELNENRTEQQTLVETDSVTKHVLYNSHFNLSNNNSVTNSGRKSTVTRSSQNSSNSESDNSDANQISAPLRYSLRSRLRRSSSNGSAANVHNARNGKSPMTVSSAEAEECGKATDGNKLVSDSVESNGKTVVSLDDIAKEISEMEKIIQSKWDVLCNKEKEKTVENGDAKAEVQPPKLRKIRSKDDLPKSHKDGEYILPMPNLTKMVPEDKNWNLEYMSEDVKNLGLDDLLLRASEFNAENFTKALGQSSTGRNGSKNDASDIMLSFPNSRRAADDSSKDGDPAKTGKKTKLDLYKKNAKDDSRPGKPAEEEVKATAEVSPKRLGIKVKTVQNINEEFKDSLGGKLKKLETSESAMNKPLYKIGSDGLKECQNNEVFMPEAQEEMVSTRPAILGRKKPVEQKNVSENSDETRPFIMTIIQNKDNAGSDRLPRVISPKVFTRPKTVSENGIEERRIESRKDGGENVTLVVSEQRSSKPFEVVNVEDYIPDLNCFQTKKTAALNYVVHYRNGTFARKRDVDGKMLQHPAVEPGFTGVVEKKNIPFILNNTKKYVRMANGEKTLVTTVEDPNKRIICPRSANRLIKHPLQTSIQTDKNKEKGAFTVTSIEQKIGLKEGGMRFTKVPSTDQTVKTVEEPRPEEESAETGDNQSPSKNQLMSLAAFSNILKDILPDRWILSLDKRYGLQILRTHLDELLNPSIMISVVVGRTGKVTVNVRGRQLEKSHDLFSNLCDIGNSSEKISINYILSIINKLKFFNVCFGCDDLSLKKYWCEDGFIEYYTEFQQTYRSHICELLVRLGKRRCYPCHRMHESLKKRKRREQLSKKDGDTPAKIPDAVSKSVEELGNHQSKAVKRNFEEFLEESFINMKQKITDEIEKTREDDESEKVPKTQDEVLSFMGLTRKDSLDVNLRKSKRERKGFKKCESMIGKNVNKEELYFLEKYWTHINSLFSTSLLVGAYSRTSTARLREKCRMFHKLLSTWRGIIRDNPDWVGGHVNVAENLVEDENDGSTNAGSVKERFDKMDVTGLRAFIINSVKEVKKIKSRLRTKNAYFKVLYNTFVKPKMKKARQSSEVIELPDEKAEDSPEKADDCGKPSNSANTTSTEMDSSDEKEEDSRQSNGVVASDGD